MIVYIVHAHFLKCRLVWKTDVTCNEFEHAHTSYSVCNHYPRHETEKSNSGYLKPMRNSKEFGVTINPGFKLPTN